MTPDVLTTKIKEHYRFGIYLSVQVLQNLASCFLTSLILLLPKGCEA